jgi:hypothetical protein
MRKKEKRRIERVKSKCATSYPNLLMLTSSLSLLFAVGVFLLYFVHVLGAVLRAHQPALPRHQWQRHWQQRQ